MSNDRPTHILYVKDCHGLVKYDKLVLTGALQSSPLVSITDPPPECSSIILRFLVR
jgi:hypothetical protein